MPPSLDLSLLYLLHLQTATNSNAFDTESRQYPGDWPVSNSTDYKTLIFFSSFKNSVRTIAVLDEKSKIYSYTMKCIIVGWYFVQRVLLTQFYRPINLR